MFVIVQFVEMKLDYVDSFGDFGEYIEGGIGLVQWFGIVEFGLNDLGKGCVIYDKIGNWCNKCCVDCYCGKVEVLYYGMLQQSVQNIGNVWFVNVGYLSIGEICVLCVCLLLFELGQGGIVLCYFGIDVLDFLVLYM